MINAPQIRAARGLLDWSRIDLANAAHISPETIKNIEHCTFKPLPQTEEAILTSLDSAGVGLIGATGVYLKT